MLWGVAAVVVAFPVFALTLRRARLDIATNPARAVNPVRRWLACLALLAAALILVGDGTGLVLSFLNGEWTSRFLLKAAVIAGLAGAAAWWLVDELRETAQDTKRQRILWYPVCAIFLAAIAAAIWVTGGPPHARLLAQDAQRVQNLRSIHHGVNRFCRENRRLPATLEECDRNPDTFIKDKNDPVTDEPCGHNVVDENSFVLSATFNLPSRHQGAARGCSGPQHEGFWRHGSGETAFRIELGKPDGN